MLQSLKKTYYALGVSMTMGLMNIGVAHAQDDGAGGNNFNDIAENINNSISSLPALLSALSYLVGLVLGVLGIMKIKDHVENPSQTELSHGAIRLAAGGALFALPIIFEAMQETVGANGDNAIQQDLQGLQFSID